VLLEVEADTLAGIDLAHAQLWGADLRSQDLRGANLSGAKLGEADLRGADLRRANLIGVVLEEADLRGADLREAVLLWANLAGARYDQETKGLSPLLAFWEDYRKVPAPGEVQPAAVPDGRETS
jgi:uncharacterized protein YjbI with pentapeptide repeats